ncbi:universal stress protein [Caballeronia sp. ATUFL_M1_KS5A]|uniref:universal stress protein n=1 Tax=Caballeronia sp. ATUFL_M1_KS5A TaxID=2921778 RepID=UPI002028D4EE|nr:universal stress protein [Caballeronia sp. ATUFL_M1_KS5A]
MESTKDAAPPSAGFARILLCLDSVEASRCAAAFTRRLAGPGTELTVAALALDPHLLASSGVLSGLDYDAAHEELQQGAQRAIVESMTMLAESAAAVRTRVIDLTNEGAGVADAVVAEAHDACADLLTLGIRQHHGLVRWFDPSVAGKLSQIAPCAMIVVPAVYVITRDIILQRILFAVDGSVTALAAVDIGARLAAADTRIRVIHVVDRAMSQGKFVQPNPSEDIFVNEGARALEAAARKLEPLRNVTPSLVSTDQISTATSEDDIASAILREAERWNADLVVLGTHGRRGDARAYLGSVPNRVASLIEIPLMLVRELA